MTLCALTASNAQRVSEYHPSLDPEFGNIVTGVGPILPKNSIVRCSPGQNQTRTNRPDEVMYFIGQMKLLLQLRVLGFGFFQEGDVRVGVFPESEEFLISCECPDSSDSVARFQREAQFLASEIVVSATAR